MRYEVYLCDCDLMVEDAILEGYAPYFETDSDEELDKWLDDHDYLDGDEYWGIFDATAKE